MAGFISSATSLGIFLVEYYWFDQRFHLSQLNYVDILVLTSIGVLICLFIIFYTISYQYGNVSQLGLILNSDIIITYIMQAVMLKKDKNFIGYIGVAIIVVVCVHHVVAASDAGETGLHRAVGECTVPVISENPNLVSQPKR